MSSTSANGAPAAPERPANGSNAAGEPLSKSALKKKEKEAAMAARKALKKAQPQQQPSTAASQPPKKKEKQQAAVEEPQIEYKHVQPGQKKDLTNPMAAGYDPTLVERDWYDWWKQCDYFVPALPSKNPTEHSHYDPKPNALKRGDNGKWDPSSINKDKVFVIPAPPPNVTGSLHIGHALAFALQDSLIRWYRMRGYTTLFTPGYDHAGISTQSVVEKRLFKATGQTRHDLGREKFLQRCMDWKDEYQTRITNQITRLAASCDWDRVAFTMNEDLSEAVAETFVRLHDDGIIYRANRLVNWCVALNTTLSNLEVDQKELTGRTLLNVPGYPSNERFEFGLITSFSYQIEGSDEKITIATTRPETMLGDTAIAVHPEDPRYKHLHGKFAVHPFVPGRRMPIVTDDIIVDMEFGTGAVKITPAHDPNDYEVGVRHNLEFINILNDDGTLNENAGDMFKGMKRFHARNAVVAKLKEIGAFVEAKDNAMSIPICSKSGDFIEPIMKPQWWVKSKPLADKAIERTRAGELKIKPATSEGDWYRWLESIQDWCISRQLWWGHRVPAYFVTVKGQPQGDRMDDKFWVSGKTRAEAEQKAKDRFPGAEIEIEQDEDVLDTWFSSGLWPFSTQRWPKQADDLEAFYPASLLETGWDILFFWVARMVMLGIHLTDKMPFNEVFCHAMIRDAHGRKMSKSLGNVIDPIDVIEGCTLEILHQKLREGNLAEKEIELAEKGQKKDFPKGIPQCGSDALRFALAAYSSAGRDINLEIMRVEGYRKFCNKLWNATKFAMLKLDEEFVPNASERPSGQESLVEKWILHKLNFAIGEVNKHLEERSFMATTNDLYNFWLYEICDVYIEAIKLVTDPSAPLGPRRSAQNTLYTVLDNGLRLLHPFMPFVTEELWQRLPRRPGNETPSIMLARFPEKTSMWDFPEASRDFDLAFGAVKAIRSAAAQYKLQSKLEVILHARGDAALAKTLREASDQISVLIKGCSSFKIVESDAEVPDGCSAESISTSLAAHLVLKGHVNVDVEVAQAEKKRQFAKDSLDKLKKQMSGPDYETKKPAQARAKDAAKADELQVEIESLTNSIEGFLKLK